MHVFPDRVDPYRLARAGTQLSGSIPASKFARLADEYPGEHADVVVRLSFGVGEDGRHAVDGELETTLELTCQRCLEAFTFESRTTVALYVERDPASRTEGSATSAREDDDGVTEPNAGGYETWLIEDETASLYTMIEDELLLGIPIMPVHPSAQCELAYSNVEAAKIEPVRGPNPFAALKGLLPGSDD